jgi:putative tryptophan/tyrosine transport system substrate-binding protein
VRRFSALAFMAISLSIVSCKARKPLETNNGTIPSGEKYKIFVVIDTSARRMQEIRDAFTARLDEILEEAGSKASYTRFETGMDVKKAAEIRKKIQRGKPDLICAINHPSGFADEQIAEALTEPEYRFVSENAVSRFPGTIADKDGAGGNVCGASPFVRLTANLELMRRVNPRVKKIYSYSWIGAEALNAFWERGLREACAEEGFELAEFARFTSHEEEMAYADAFSSGRADAAIIACMSPAVNADGSRVNPLKAGAEYAAFLQKRLAVPYLSYEDSNVSIGALLGACIDWKDLGAQLADLGARVLAGENPGSIPWEYARNEDIVVNAATAERLGLTIPADILAEASTVFIDYAGNTENGAE